jgi:hypothetical protein
VKAIRPELSVIGEGLWGDGAGQEERGSGERAGARTPIRGVWGQPDWRRGGLFFCGLAAGDFLIFGP